MGLLSTLYQGIFKKTSTFTLAVCVGAVGVRIAFIMILNMIGLKFQFERGFDALADYAWESTNKGKLWKDIKHKYENAEEE